MSLEYAPTVRGRRLAAELRQLRERAGLAPDDAAAAIGWSRAKLVKLETARTMPTVVDVDKVLRAYGGNDQALGLALLELTRRVRDRGWWVPYNDVLSDFASYAELEDTASQVRSVQKELVPGLLQTPAYARSLIAEFTADPVEIERRLQARMTRQTILTRQPAPVLDVVLAEEVLRRPIGGAEVMREQLEALITAGRKPNVSIRVVPSSIGHYPAIGQGSLVIFGFESPVDLDTAYVETIPGGHYIEEMQQVNRCTFTFHKIAATALGEEESAEFIARIAKDEWP